MLVKGFGINADAGWLDGDPALLEKELAYYAGKGFTHVEIPVHGVGAVRNCAPATGSMPARPWPACVLCAPMFRLIAFKNYRIY